MKVSRNNGKRTMKTTIDTKPHPMSRRKFIAHTSLATPFMIAPQHVLGGAERRAPNERINVAFIGVGSQGLRVMLNFLGQPDVQGVAVCDPNKGSGDHPQSSRNEFCNAARRLMGTQSGW